MSSNPLLDDRGIDFLLYESLSVGALCRLPVFGDHSRETFDMLLQSARRFARDVLYPTYKPMDQDPPVFREGAVSVHPQLKAIFPRLAALGLINACRPESVGGMQLPLAVHTAVAAYLMAANAGAYGYIGLTAGAARLIESFGDSALRDMFMSRMYAGEWLGTMALTEPQAGSSLSDVQTTATPRDDGTYSLKGAKIFISGGDQDLSENIVHMTLARIAGAPAGIKGVSLFAVPKRRPGPDGLISNDVSIAGVIHKIGWRGIPSVALSYGENDDCLGWLVGEPHRGIGYMFQMMNEARIMVGANAASTASVAYLESLEYARTRLQGRAAAAKDPAIAQVPIIEHADVRRMLLRQKSIVEGSMGLLIRVGLYADLAEHAATEPERRSAQLLLDLLTPIAKSFPAERGFESNALAVQIHGGYGYSSEYMPEAWLRDQKLNSIHEGTTGIQSMDLLGRRAVAAGGGALAAWKQALEVTAARARVAGVDESEIERVTAAAALVCSLTLELAARGQAGDVDGMMQHSVDYLELFAISVIAWEWLEQAAAAHEGLACGGGSEDFYRGKQHAARYWFATELPRITHLADLCRSGEDSYARMRPEWF